MLDRPAGAVDPISLEIFWNRLISLADQATVILDKTAFSATISTSPSSSVNRVGG